MLQTFRGLCKTTAPSFGYHCPPLLHSCLSSPRAGFHTSTTGNQAASWLNSYKVKGSASFRLHVRLVRLYDSQLIPSQPSSALHVSSFASMHFAPPVQRLGGEMHFSSSLLHNIPAGQPFANKRQQPTGKSQRFVAYAAAGELHIPLLRGHDCLDPAIMRTIRGQRRWLKTTLLMPSLRSL